MADRFHVNQNLWRGVVVLQGPEAHHLATVCRVRPNDEIFLFNGDGNEYLARVIEVSRRDVTVEVIDSASPSRELPFLLHVAVPLPKGDRAQFLVEKLTELGVQKLTLLSCKRSVVHPREAKLDKLRRYVIEASKQCGRNLLMEIEELVEFDTFLRRETLPERRLLAHPGGTGGWPRVGSDVVTLVGPEGGFTQEEVDQAREAGWQTINLGSRILRMETAALAMAAKLALTSDPADAATLP